MLPTKYLALAKARNLSRYWQSRYNVLSKEMNSLKLKMDLSKDPERRQIFYDRWEAKNSRLQEIGNTITQLDKIADA